MSGRANCNPHKFQPSPYVIRITRACNIRLVRRHFTFFRRGAAGISRDIRDQRRKGLRMASSAPPALALSKVLNSKNSLPCASTQCTKTGMARESRSQRRRSTLGWVAAENPLPQRICNHSQYKSDPPGRVTTNDIMIRVVEEAVREEIFQEGWVSNFAWVLRGKAREHFLVLQNYDEQG